MSIEISAEDVLHLSLDHLHLNLHLLKVLDDEEGIVIAFLDHRPYLRVHFIQADLQLWAVTMIVMLLVMLLAEIKYPLQGLFTFQLLEGFHLQINLTFRFFRFGLLRCL